MSDSPSSQSKAAHELEITDSMVEAGAWAICSLGDPQGEPTEWDRRAARSVLAAALAIADEEPER